MSTSAWSGIRDWRYAGRFSSLEREFLRGMKRLPCTSKAVGECFDCLTMSVRSMVFPYLCDAYLAVRPLIVGGNVARRVLDLSGKLIYAR